MKFYPRYGVYIEKPFYMSGYFLYVAVPSDKRQLYMQKLWKKSIFHRNISNYS